MEPYCTDPEELMSAARNTLFTALACLSVSAASLTAPASAQSPAEASAPASTATTTATGLRAASNALYENWAGYQVAAKNPTQARGSWTVPKASWPGRDGYSNMWVGLGGGNRAQGQLIQAGTEHDSKCVALRAGKCSKWKNDYYLWVETFPQRSQERITNLPVSPGDPVRVAVRWSARDSRAYFTLCNERLQRCVVTSRATSAPKGVAEFVLERPSRADGRPLALANTGTVSFRQLSVTDASGTRVPKKMANTRISMFNGNLLASPGAWSASGNGFPVTFKRAA